MVLNYVNPKSINTTLRVKKKKTKQLLTIGHIIYIENGAKFRRKSTGMRR